MGVITIQKVLKGSCATFNSTLHIQSGQTQPYNKKHNNETDMQCVCELSYIMFTLGEPSPSWSAGGLTLSAADNAAYARPGTLFRGNGVWHSHARRGIMTLSTLDFPGHNRNCSAGRVKEELLPKSRPWRHLTDTSACSAQMDGAHPPGSAQRDPQPHTEDIQWTTL